jgi:hypothetical protein
VIRCQVCRKKKQQGTSGYVHIPRRRRGKGDKTP